uniref:Uncharacterized protein n=1 Tax=Boldia erythrosiphon TaxID=74908 RepID=A0A1Y9TLN9_9RHOD|nr:hypothetical protein [Boldia erythrosiphon]ARO90516.1 hypothetical protein [Boldia erythrosiphon]
MKLDFLLLALESLDMEFIDRIIFSQALRKQTYLNFSKIHLIRLSNFYRINYIDIGFDITFREIIYLVYLIYKILISSNFRDFTQSLLNFIVNIPSDFSYNILVLNYLKRFKFYFRQHMNLSMVTQQVYYSDEILDNFAIQNLYIIYLLSRLTSIIDFWYYFKRYNFYFLISY